MTEFERNVVELNENMKTVLATFDDIKEGKYPACVDHHCRIKACEGKIQWLWGAIGTIITLIAILKLFT